MAESWFQTFTFELHKPESVQLKSVALNYRYSDYIPTSFKATKVTLNPIPKKVKLGTLTQKAEAMSDHKLLPEENHPDPKPPEQSILSNIQVGGSLTINGNIVQILNQGDDLKAKDFETKERQNRLDAAMQRSRARCIVRWQGAGVSEGDAIAFADDQSIGVPQLNLQISAGKLIILTGEMGAGKSLFAERLFQSAIQKAKDENKAPIPVYFEAWQLQDGRLLEQAVEEATRGLCNPATQGTLVIIDGADEVGTSNAVRLLKEVRIIVQVWQQATVVLTSRPIPDFANAEESLEIPLLSRQASHDLVSQLAGRRIYSLSQSLSESIRDAILRPLFAVLLGTYLREHKARMPRSKEQLLSSLVERSLHPLAENVTRVSKLLEQLAASSIDNGSATVPVAQVASWVARQQLLDSRLLVEHLGGLRFPLPILTQWFAAQSLATGETTTEKLSGDSRRLELWRYPLLIATATLPISRVSELLTPIVEKQPAIAAEIVNEALADQSRVIKMPLLPSLELGRQVRTAMQAWAMGIEPLAPLISPVLKNGTLPTTGVRLSEKALETHLPVDTYETVVWVEIAWHHGEENLPDVVELPSGMNGSDLHLAGWKSVYGFVLYQQPSWAWQWTLEQIVDSLSKLLQQRSLPVGTGYLSLEAAWHAALHLLKHHRFYSNPIPLNSIEEPLSRARRELFSPMIKHCLNQLRIQIESLRERGQTYLSLPSSAQVFRNSQVLSPEILLAYTVDIYQGAIEGYQQLVNTLFSKFIPKLQLASILPAQLVGVVVPPKYSSDAVSVSWYWEPLHIGSHSRVDFKLSERSISSDDPRFRVASEQLSLLRPHAQMYLFLKRHTESTLTKNWHGNNPVTELVYQWLWEDLKNISWVKGELGHAGYPYWR